MREEGKEGKTRERSKTEKTGRGAKDVRTADGGVKGGNLEGESV